MPVEDLTARRLAGLSIDKLAIANLPVEKTGTRCAALQNGGKTAPPSGQDFLLPFQTACTERSLFSGHG